MCTGQETSFPKASPVARVLTYGYDTKVRHALASRVSKNSMYDHAWDLLCSLEVARRGESESGASNFVCRS